MLLFTNIAFSFFVVFLGGFLLLFLAWGHVHELLPLGMLLCVIDIEADAEHRMSDGTTKRKLILVVK